jgi:hypothetical protein
MSLSDIATLKRHSQRQPSRIHAGLGEPIYSLLPAQSTLMLVEDLFDFLHGEIIKLHDPGLRAHRGGHDGAGLLAAVHVRDDPGFVLAVLASPVCMRQEITDADG